MSRFKQQNTQKTTSDATSDNEDSTAVRGAGRDLPTQNTLQIQSLPMMYTAADSCGGWNGLRRMELRSDGDDEVDSINKN